MKLVYYQTTCTGATTGARRCDVGCAAYLQQSLDAILSGLDERGVLLRIAEEWKAQVGREQRGGFTSETGLSGLIYVNYY